MISVRLTPPEFFRPSDHSSSHGLLAVHTVGGYVGDSYRIRFKVGRQLKLTPVAFSALRVFALCGRPYKWPVSMAVLVLSSVIVVMNFVRRRFLINENNTIAKLGQQSRLHWIVSLDDMVLGTSCIAFASRLPTQEANRL